jgi:hypothetical protein
MPEAAAPRPAGRQLEGRRLIAIDGLRREDDQVEHAVASHACARDRQRVDELGRPREADGEGREVALPHGRVPGRLR